MDRKTRSARRAAVLALASLLTACGGDGDDKTPTAYDNHLPLQVGDRQVYRVIDNTPEQGDSMYFVSESVIGTRMIEGATFYEVQASLEGFDFRSTSFYAASASAIQVRSPTDPSLVLDLVRFPAPAGGSFVQDVRTAEDVDSDGQPDAGTIRYTTSISGIETLTTSTATFTNALHVRDDIVVTTRLSSTSAEETETGSQDTWYVPGVGRVRTTLAAPDYSYVQDLMVRLPAGQPQRDTTPPRLLSVTPAQGQPVHAGTPVVLTFDEPVSDSVVNAVTVVDTFGTTRDLRRVAPFDPSGRTVALAPVFGLPSGASTIRVAAGIKDLSGNAMASQPDTSFVGSTALAVTYAIPQRQATNIRQATGPMQAYLNTWMARSSASAITLRENGTAVPATVEIDAADMGITVTPVSPLKPSTRYTIDLSGVRSLVDGSPIANPQDWTFTTGASMTMAPRAAPARRTASRQLRAR